MFNINHSQCYIFNLSSFKNQKYQRVIDPTVVTTSSDPSYQTVAELNPAYNIINDTTINVNANDLDYEIMDNETNPVHDITDTPGSNNDSSDPAYDTVIELEESEMKETIMTTCTLKVYYELV